MAQERRRTGWPAAVAAWLLFAAAALAPLPFGSTGPPAIAFCCIVLGACLVFAPVPRLGGQNNHLQRWAVSKRVNSSKADKDDATLTEPIKAAA